MLKNRALAALAFFAIVLLLGAGLCGVGSVLDRPHPNHEFGGDVSFYGFLTCLLGIVGLAVSALIAVIAALVRVLRNKRAATLDDRSSTLRRESEDHR